MANHSSEICIIRMIYLLVGAILVAAFLFSTECYVLTNQSLWRSSSIRNTTIIISSERQEALTKTGLDYFHVFCNDVPHRCATLDRSRRFSFLHVSKSGGSSWIKELGKIELGSLYPRKTEGEEWSQIFQKRTNTTISATI